MKAKCLISIKKEFSCIFSRPVCNFFYLFFFPAIVKDIVIYISVHTLNHFMEISSGEKWFSRAYFLDFAFYQI